MPKGKIVVIDDDSKALTVAKRLLEAAGYEVITSESPLRMPQLVQRERPNLILLDLEMPALSGEHVLDFTTLFDFLREIPIVLHSAKNEDELKSLVERSAAVGYIRKTNNGLSFVAQVERFIAESQRSV